MIKAIIKLFRMLIGFLFCAVSAVMAINSNLGVSPWDALHQGLSIKSGLTMGQSSILVSFVLILFTRLWGFKIGLGTISNMLVVGFLIDVIYFCQIIPRSSGLFMSMTFLLGSIMANALGCYFYISCELGAGPRDGFMIVISSILSFPISIVRAIIELAVATMGYLLGGLIGTGTVVIAVLLGVFLQIIFRLFNFDVKKASHKSLNDSLRNCIRIIIGSKLFLILSNLFNLKNFRRNNMGISVKKADESDFNEIIRILDGSIKMLKESGSPQWSGDDTPTEQSIYDALKRKKVYVLIIYSRVIGVAILTSDFEKAYDHIKYGSWEISDEMYYSIHRFAIDPAENGKGYAKVFFSLLTIIAKEKGAKDIRVDTHPMNEAMQKVILSNGYKFKGIINLPIRNGERYAYEKILS